MKLCVFRPSEYGVHLSQPCEANEMSRRAGSYIWSKRRLEHLKAKYKLFFFSHRRDVREKDCLGPVR